VRSFGFGGAEKFFYRLLKNYDDRRLFARLRRRFAFHFRFDAIMFRGQQQRRTDSICRRLVGGGFLYFHKLI
jgi:hypothetical protein